MDRLFLNYFDAIAVTDAIVFFFKNTLMFFQANRFKFTWRENILKNIMFLFALNFHYLYLCKVVIIDFNSLKFESKNRSF